MDGGDNGDKPKDDGGKIGGDQDSKVEENPANRAANEFESPMSPHGACALPPENSSRENETQPKSHLLNNLHFSRRYQSAIGCSSPQQGPFLPGQLGDTSQDISLNERISGQAATGSNTVSSPGSSSSTALTSPALTPISPLQMNILPSISPVRVNNTDIPVGMAEGQLSFQEVPPSVTIPHALHPTENPLSTMPLSTISNMTRNSSTGDTSPASNIAVSNLHSSPGMSARPISGEMNSCPISAGAAAQVTAGSMLSHSDSRQSLKSIILPECQVRKLPKSILMFIVVEMKRSWEDLVELYGWNFHETQLFQERHPNDVFLALLKEDHFQTYTLSQFQADLQRLPRKDLLCDLDEKIEAHNEKYLNSS